MDPQMFGPPLKDTMNASFPPANGTGGGPVRRDRQSHVNIVCDQCDVQCVLSAVSLVLSVGVVANMFVIILVIKDKTLHTPTFIAIAGLAFADMMFLSISLVLSVEVLLVVFLCVEDFTRAEYFGSVLSILWKNATFNVVLLAVVRYILLVHPFKAKTDLTNKRILVSITAIMLLAVIYTGCFQVALAMTHLTKPFQQTRMIIDWFASYLLPLCVTAVLHILKVLSVRRSINKTRKMTSATLSESSNNSKPRTVIGDMARVIVFVLVAAFMLPLPRFFVFIVEQWTGIMKNFSLETNNAIMGIANLLYFVTFAINPFIYALKSPLFQTSMRSQFYRRRQ